MFLGLGLDCIQVDSKCIRIGNKSEEIRWHTWRRWSPIIRKSHILGKVALQGNTVEPLHVDYHYCIISFSKAKALVMRRLKSCAACRRFLMPRISDSSSGRK